MKINKKLLFSTIFILFLTFVLSLNNSQVNAATKKIDISTNYNYYISIPNSTYEYTGKAIKPKVTFYTYDSSNNRTELKEGTDFKVSYENNIKIGYAQAIVTGIGKYKGTRSYSFTICKYDISKATISNISDIQYTGKLIKPKVTIKYKNKTLTEGTDYTIGYTIYSNNVTPIGQSYISIYGKGDFGGTNGTSFNIIPSKITNVKTSLKNNGIKISWKKSSQDVDGYEIYRKTSSNGKYKYLTTVSKDISSYLDKSPDTTGETYYYKVRAYKTVSYTKYIGKNSSPSSITFAQGVTYTLKSGNDYAYLKWNEINGADAYQIYRATSKDGEYVRIKTEKGQDNCSYKDKNIKPYKTYYYKIRCYAKTSSGKVYSKFSDRKEKTPLAKTNLKKAKYSDNKVKLSWDKIKKIDGYRIYRATSENGKYSKIATVSSKKTSFTDKKITVGKTYYYKIRAYKNKNNKKIFGDYSDVKLSATGSRKQQMNKVKLSPDKDFKNSGFGSYYTDYEKLIKKHTNSKISTYTKVKTMYKYLVKNLSHADGYHCKNFAGTFAGMCRVIGVDAYCATGQTRTTGGSYTAHTWTIVNINGKEYIFDASLDKHAADRSKKSVSYNYFFKTYSELPKVYKAEGYENMWPFFMVPANNLK